MNVCTIGGDTMQNPNEDTEWNSILRAKGILPQKEEATLDEDTLVQVVHLLTRSNSQY